MSTTDNISTEMIPPKRALRSGGARPIELSWFRSLRPRLHPWIEITPQPDGGAELYDFIMATRLHLNPTAHAIVERMRAGNQTLGEIASALATPYNLSEHQVLADVVRMYKQLENNDAVEHPAWRYGVLWVMSVRQLVKEFIHRLRLEFYSRQ